MVKHGFPTLASSSPTLKDLFQIACEAESVTNGMHVFTLTSSDKDIAAQEFRMSVNYSSKYDEYILHDIGLSGPTVRAVLGPALYRVYVKTLTGKVLTFYCQSDDTTFYLELLIQECEGLPTDQCRLIFCGKQLEEPWSLGHYHIVAESTIHIVLRLRGGMMHPSSARCDMEEIANEDGPETLVPVTNTNVDSGLTEDIFVDADHAKKEIKYRVKEANNATIVPGGKTDRTDSGTRSGSDSSPSSDSIETKERRVKRLRAELKAAEEDLLKNKYAKQE
jgi:Ubiquitin family